LACIVFLAVLLSADSSRKESAAGKLEVESAGGKLEVVHDNPNPAVQAALDQFLPKKEEFIQKLVDISTVKEDVGKSARPRFYITYGPPGSGKARIICNTVHFERLAVDRSEDRKDYLVDDNRTGCTNYLRDDLHLVEVIVDDMLANLPNFKEVKEDLEQSSGGKKAAQAFYWGLRDGIVNELGDDIVKGAQRKSRNIVMEMTGRYIEAGWWMDFLDKQVQRNYKVIVAYPLVQIGTLYNRARLRQEKTGQEAAPLERIIEIAVGASSNLITHGFTTNIDMVLFFDNEGTKPQLLFAYQRDGKNYAYCNKLRVWLNEQVVPDKLVNVADRPALLKVQEMQAQVEINLRKFVRPIVCNNPVYDVKQLPHDKACESIKGHIDCSNAM